MKEKNLKKEKNFEPETLMERSEEMETSELSDFYDEQDSNSYSNILTDFENNHADEEFLVKLFNNDIDNEDTLFELASRDQIPQLALNKQLIKDTRFDYFHGLINLIRRLLRIHDEAIDQWMGIDGDENCDFMSIISFIFNIVDDYYERFCMVEIVEFSDL